MCGYPASHIWYVWLSHLLHIDRGKFVTCPLNSSCYNCICVSCIVYALANPVKMFNRPAPPCCTLWSPSPWTLHPSWPQQASELNSVASAFDNQHPVMMLNMAFCNTAKELVANTRTPSLGANIYIVIKLNSCPIQYLVLLHIYFLCLLDTKNSCSFLFVVTSSISCAAIITSLQLYVYLSLRQNIQYVEYYGRFLRQTTSSCTFVMWIEMKKWKFLKKKSLKMSIEHTLT